MVWFSIPHLSVALEPRIRAVFLVIWQTNALSLPESIVLLVMFIYLGFKIRASMVLNRNFKWHLLESTCDVYGSKLREQVEDRLKFYESGDIPRKNVDVMQEAIIEANAVLVIWFYFCSIGSGSQCNNATCLFCRLPWRRKRRRRRRRKMVSKCR